MEAGKSLREKWELCDSGRQEGYRNVDVARECSPSSYRMELVYNPLNLPAKIGPQAFIPTLSGFLSLQVLPCSGLDQGFGFTPFCPLPSYLRL